jgi:glycosyltransferase involved in cell wall biosynthesis
MIKLSILVCSTHTRRASFLPGALDMLYGQWERLLPGAQEQVEILFLVDNKQMMLGTKRNAMVDIAQGEYVVFVDDDDEITDDYIIELLKATHKGCDVITFLVSVTLNGGAPKLCRYSIDYDADHNTDEMYHRLPNHICAVRRTLAAAVEYPAIPYGEDSGYSKLLHPLLSSEYRIEKVLYHYMWDQDTTETQMHLKNRKKRPR